MTKKRKQSSSPDHNITDDAIQQQDFISKLPDALLLHILSLLSESDANRTRILSNRWKHLPTFLPNLRFVLSNCEPIEEHDKRHNSVDQTLALRGGIPIERFSLHCSRFCDYDRVYHWLFTVVKCQVQQLELDFSAGGCRVRFCWNLFKTCNTLVSVTLKGDFQLDVPKSEVLFPCLKKLELLSVYYSVDQSVENLISGSPVLEELFVKRQVFRDGLLMFNVSSHSLKRLRMLFTNNGSRRMMGGLSACVSVIDVPNLEYLKVEDKMTALYSFTNMPSLVEAHMDTTGTAAKLLKCLSSAKTLTLTFSTIQVVLAVQGIGMCRFSNLVKLVIDINRGMHWKLLLLFFLNNMPNLQHITFLNGLQHVQPSDSISWDPPEVAPACLRSKMKKMIILNREAVTQDELPFLSYLLEHSSILETFTINAHDIDPERRDQILNFHRGSNLCRIEFV